MERIKITEIDNTSNVEALSSYDVVYVPGFAGTGASADNFRKPILVTSRYQFTNIFGDKVPRFTSPQYYPEATMSDKGFPPYAIPNYKKLVVDSTRMNLCNFSDVELVSEWYVHEDIVAEAGADDWVKEEGRNYFLLTGTEGNWEVHYSTLPLNEGQTYVERYGAGGSDNVYTSRISPAAQGWFESGTSGPVRTADTQIEPDSNTEDGFKSYYQATQNASRMFDTNDPDPGYRYALFLLSLGIPVYYEQMNTGVDSEGFEEVDLLSDFNTSLMRYGRVDDEGVYYISPAENQWFVENAQGVLVRYKDADPEEPLHITSAEQVTQTYSLN